MVSPNTDDHEFHKGDPIELVRDVKKIKAGTPGVFRDYIDDMTVEVDLGETKWEIVSLADIKLSTSV